MIEKIFTFIGIAVVSIVLYRLYNSKARKTESQIDEKSLEPITDEEIENLDEMSSEFESPLEAILKYINSDPRKENTYRSLQSEIETISGVLRSAIRVGNSIQNKNSAQEYLHNSTVAKFEVSLAEAKLKLMEYNLTAWYEVVALNEDSYKLHVNDFNKFKIFILRMKKKYQEDLATSKNVLNKLSNMA